MCAKFEASLDMTKYGDTGITKILFYILRQAQQNIFRESANAQNYTACSRNTALVRGKRESKLIL